MYVEHPRVFFCPWKLKQVIRSLKLTLQADVSYPVVAGNEPKSSAAATRVLNHCAISLAPVVQAQWTQEPWNSSFQTPVHLFCLLLLKSSSSWVG